jgi:hypothetical protein
MVLSNHPHSVDKYLPSPLPLRHPCLKEEQEEVACLVQFPDHPLNDSITQIPNGNEPGSSSDHPIQGDIHFSVKPSMSSITRMKEVKEVAIVNLPHLLLPLLNSQMTHYKSKKKRKKGKEEDREVKNLRNQL